MSEGCAWADCSLGALSYSDNFLGSQGVERICFPVVVGERIGITTSRKIAQELATESLVACYATPWIDDCFPGHTKQEFRAEAPWTASRRSGKQMRSTLAEPLMRDDCLGESDR